MSERHGRSQAGVLISDVGFIGTRGSVLCVLGRGARILDMDEKIVTLVSLAGWLAGCRYSAHEGLAAGSA